MNVVVRRTLKILLNFEAGLTKSIENASPAEAPKNKRVGIIFVDLVKLDA